MSAPRQPSLLESVFLLRIRGSFLYISISKTIEVVLEGVSDTDVAWAVRIDIGSPEDFLDHINAYIKNIYK
jgi:hypothetical protein